MAALDRVAIIAVGAQYYAGVKATGEPFLSSRKSSAHHFWSLEDAVERALEIQGSQIFYLERWFAPAHLKDKCSWLSLTRISTGAWW